VPERPSVIIDVVLCQTLLFGGELKGARCAAVDVLRATTTIVTAMASGAKSFMPFMSSNEIRDYVKSRRRAQYVLGGEEKGLKIPGFDLGNSPFEYLPENVVAGRTVLFSTTNGTPAMRRAYAESGYPVNILSLVNIAATTEAMLSQAKNDKATKIALVCAGKGGKPSSEDTYCAGLIVKRLAQRLTENGLTPDLTDSASIAEGFAAKNESRALQVLRECEHGRSLIEIGFERDLEFAGKVDHYGIAPIFDGNEIRLTEE